MGLHERYPAYGGRGPEAMRIGIALTVIATILIFMRIYVRLRINKFGTAALIWAIAAWVLALVTQVLAIIAVLHGLGNHLSVIEEAGVVRDFMFFTWLTVFFFNAAIPVGKVAAATFLIEMNAQTNPKTRWALIAVSVINMVINIPQVLLVWLQCDPVDALWDPLRQDKCNLKYNVYTNYVVGSIAVLTDFYLAMVPIHMLRPLQIDKKLKWGLCILMGLGVLAAVAAIIRTWAAKFILEEDSSYGIGILFRWGETEEWLVIICSSIPPVWPLFRPYCQRFLDSVPKTTHRSNRYTDLAGTSPVGNETAKSHQTTSTPKRHSGFTFSSTQKSRHPKVLGQPLTATEDCEAVWPIREPQFGNQTTVTRDYIEMGEMSSVGGGSRDIRDTGYR